MHDELIQNIEAIENRIMNACEKSGRNREEIKLLLATKTVSAKRIEIALNAGYRLIAENKIQEVKEKYEALARIPHESHFIGHLQTNKIKEILRYNIDCIESLDRLELAEKLHQRLTIEDKHLDVLVQVNTSKEVSKFGVDPAGAIDLIKAVAQLNRLHIRGLMTIGLFSAEPALVRPCFQLLKQLSEDIKTLHIPNVQMRELSMGMSGDLEIAIEEGATIVRIGTAIFGKRIYPDSYYWNEQNN